METKEQRLSIGELARTCGVGVETIRFYVREGLLEPPPRPSVGFRRYPELAVRRVRFIRRAKELGFSLSEIRELLALSVERSGSCEDVRKLAVQKLADIEGRIRSLERLRQKLASLATDCARSSRGECPILDVLEEEL